VRADTLCASIHRLVPLIQPPETSTPDAWVEKWKVLDDSFELTIRALSKIWAKALGLWNQASSDRLKS
jgi:hypothetical protein